MGTAGPCVSITLCLSACPGEHRRAWSTVCLCEEGSKGVEGGSLKPVSARRAIGNAAEENPVMCECSSQR